MGSYGAIRTLTAELGAEIYNATITLPRRRLAKAGRSVRRYLARPQTRDIMEMCATWLIYMVFSAIVVHFIVLSAKGAMTQAGHDYAKKVIDSTESTSMERAKLTATIDSLKEQLAAAAAREADLAHHAGIQQGQINSLSDELSWARTVIDAYWLEYGELY